MCENLNSSGSPIHISYEEYSPDVAPIILLHGMTSSKEAWKECAKIIGNKTGSKVYYYDARNHGDSDWSEIWDYDSMAEDLLNFMNLRNISNAVIVGHSMGGKTALKFALEYPKRINCLIIEDISIFSPSSNRDIVIKYVKQLLQVPDIIPPNISITEAKKLIASRLNEKKKESEESGKSNDTTLSPRQLDGTNLPLVKTKNGFKWKTNLEKILDSLTNGLPTFNKDGRYEGPVLVIYGAKSPFKVLEDKDNLLEHFPKAQHVPIEGGSHSLHTEFPEIFCQLVCDFIIKNRSS